MTVTAAQAWPRRALDRLQDARVCWIVLGVGMVVYAALALWLTRGTTLFVDEVNVFTVDRGFHPSALLAPLNGHLVLLQRLVWATDFKLFGPSFLVLRLVEVAGAIAAVGLFFELARRRIGAAAALAPALLLLFLGSAWELNFVPSGIGNVYAVAAGLGAVLALERGDRRGDLIACALLAVAVASFTLGVAFAVGAAVLILLQPGWRRRVWVAVVPLALYAAWIVWVRLEYVPTHGEIQNFHVWNILLIPNFIADEASSVAGAVAGLNYNFQPQSLYWIFSTDSPYGPVLAAAAAVALAVRLYRGSRPALLWALMAILLAFWTSLALGFDIRIGRNPVTVRYVYAGAILAVLVGAEAARGLRLSPAGLVALYAITVVALGANLARLRDGAHFYRSFTTSLRAQLTGLELARDHVSPGFMASSPTSFLAPVRAGPYLAAVDRNGSPAYSPAELARQPEDKRHDADAVVVAALRIGIAPAAPGATARNCRRVAGGSSVTLPVGPPGVRLTAPASAAIALRRYASTSTVPVGSLPPGRAVDLRIPPDRSRRTWQAVVTPAPGGVTVCELPAGA
ncbi:MAG TPA: hypothetical protein VGN78_11010 [Solirubrobacteraceae bacterium]|nr:hypothetical protein [Solirubrobacteraceae bacterium]